MMKVIEYTDDTPPRKRSQRWRGKQLHPRYMLYWVALFDMLERRFRTRLEE